jgi:Spy/CpxP family protein refolding chaperone
MKLTLKRILTLGATCALAVGLTFAQGPGGPPPGGGHGRMEMMTNRLNLTADQQTQVKAIFDQERLASEPLRAQLNSLHTSVEAAVKANDAAQITQLSHTLGGLMGQMEAIRLQAQAKVYALLTPAQQQLFSASGPGGFGGGPGRGMRNNNNR